MVRPRCSFQNQQLALEFAETVTAEADDSVAMVARAGAFCIFSVFARCCPWAVCTNDDGPRDGVRLKEFNKLLESHGFVRVRKSADPTCNFADPGNPEYTGAYAFANRRWRDPTDADDVEALIQGRIAMQALFCNGQKPIADETHLLSSVLDAKIEGDRRARSSSSTPEPSRRKRYFDDEDEKHAAVEHAHKRPRSGVEVELGLDLGLTARWCLEFSEIPEWEQISF